MSDDTTIQEQHTPGTEEKIIITDNAEKEKDPLDVDLNLLTDKELLAFERKDLFAIAENKKVFGDLKKWQIDRLNKKNLIKLLRAKEKGSSVPKNKDKESKENDSENQNSIILLQGAIIDIFTKGDPAKLDIFATETLQNNEQEFISIETKEKLDKGLVYFSMGHLLVRSMGGYKNLWQKAKEFYIKLKEKKNANSNRS